MKQWSKVRLEVREQFHEGQFKSADDWPIAQTHYRKLFLDSASQRLQRSAPEIHDFASYDSLDESGRVVFDWRFEEMAEIVGHMKLRLFVAAESADDLDLFIAIQKLDRDGRHVGFASYATYEDGPVALGWLRVSHRELDEQASTEYQPVLKHQRALKVKPGEIVPVDIEILPSGTRFSAGETLRLVIAGRDLYDYQKPMLAMHHESTVNRGRHQIHTGPEHPSYLLVPFEALGAPSWTTQST